MNGRSAPPVAEAIDALADTAGTTLPVVVAAVAVLDDTTSGRRRRRLARSRPRAGARSGARSEIERRPSRPSGQLKRLRSGRAPKVKGNLPVMPDRTTEAWLGKKLPRREVKASAPPVVGATAITGPMGAGKTALMTRMARTYQLAGRHAKRPQDAVELWTTGMNILGEDRHFDGHGDVGRALIHMAEALDDRANSIPWTERGWVVLAMDEMAVQADSRNYHEFPKSLAAQLTQIRKFKVIPLYTAVFWERVDSLVRDFTGWVWHVEMSSGLFGGTIVGKCWPPDAERTEDERPHRVIRMRLRRGDVQAFDTGNVVRKDSASAAADLARDTDRRAKLAAAAKRKELQAGAGT